VSGFVLDCSVAVTWIFEDEAAAETDALLDQLRDDGAMAPALFPLELANVLAQAERRGRLTAAALATRVALIGTLPITIDSETASRALHEALALARAEKLRACDAAYLELAMRLALPLATRDEALRRAAARLDVALLPT
jgi:predicted nucleic acid-binding protein